MADSPRQRPLVKITLTVDDVPDPPGIHMELDIADPADGIDGGVVIVALAAVSGHMASALDAAWASILAERN